MDNSFVANGQSAPRSLHFLVKPIIGLAVLASLTACQHASSSRTHIDTSRVMGNEHMSPSQKSEALALAAEQLIMPSGFIYADQVASLALQLDPGNARARFWKAALGPVIQARGIASRVAPPDASLGQRCRLPIVSHEFAQI